MKKVQFQVDDTYFQNIAKSIDSLNSFFSSDFKINNFPSIDDDEDDIEPVIGSIIRWMNYINPTWINDSNKIDDAIDRINNIARKYKVSHKDPEDNDDGILSDLADDSDDMSLSLINSYIGYQMAQYISKNKSEFEELLEGISTLELFFKPSKYKNSIDTFSDGIEIDDISDVVGNTKYYVFDPKTYVNGIFHSEYINIPSTMNLDHEYNRFINKKDIPEYEIIKDNDNDETYQEQAEINFFAMVNPNHIRYHQNRFQPSQQFVKVIKALIAGLKQCKTPDDVKEFINDKSSNVNPDDYTSMVLPSILANTFANEKDFKNRLFNDKNLKKYTDSYESIIKQNDGAKGLKEYDLFTMFKADKDATIKFLEDFLSLRLVSDEKAYISNHTLLVLFNVFDSRIYLDILYNVLPASEKKGNFDTEDNFVKTIRKRINDNSNKANPYDAHKKNDDKIDNTIKTPGEIQEQASYMIKSLGDFDESDYKYIGHIVSEACKMEISTLESIAYNNGISEEEFVNMIQEASPYAISGKLPNYMQTRINDVEKHGGADTKVEEVPIPEGVPTNDINDLIDSIDERVDAVEPDESGNMDLSDGFGNDANVKPSNGNNGNQNGGVVYNITYNYHNSNNTTTTTDSHNTHNDLSVNKTTGGTSANTYNGIRPNHNKSNNNYNNTTSTNPTDRKNDDTKNDTFSTGKSIQEVFEFLNGSGEPPLVVEGVGKVASSAVNSFGADMGLLPETNPEPKPDLTTRAMDFDRKMLSKEEGLRKNLQAVTNTGKAIKRPFDRAKATLTDWIDDIIKQDEDKTKYRMLEDKNFRTHVSKLFRLACNAGLYVGAFALSPYIGALALAGGVAKYANNTEMKKEVQKDFVTELQIIDDKIRRARDKGDYEAAYELMRIRRKMVDKASKITKDPIAKVKPLDSPMNKHGYDYW